jgi:hypothetical protein
VDTNRNALNFIQAALSLDLNHSTLAQDAVGPSTQQLSTSEARLTSFFPRAAANGTRTQLIFKFIAL